MKKTIIYGGAFNPPTIAHEVILQACVDYAKKIDADLWIMPSGNRLDKQIIARRDMRVRYVNAMINDARKKDKVIEIITLELDRLRAVKTCDTVKELVGTYPNRSFIWVFGADSVETMPSWKNGQWLLNNLDMIVIERKGSKIVKPAKNIKILDVEVPNISSTELRRRLGTGEPIDNLVGKSVKRLLKLNR